MTVAREEQFVGYDYDEIDDSTPLDSRVVSDGLHEHFGVEDTEITSVESKNTIGSEAKNVFSYGGEGYGVEEDLGAHGEHHPELSQRFKTVAKIAGGAALALGVAYGLKKGFDKLNGPSHNQD